ncbi:MAG: hypothetical protein ABW187_02055 [Dokdonella sp.]
MLIRGGCHCGNIAFALTWEPDPATIPARACTCSFCSKHGGVWTSNPHGALRIALENDALVSRYAFGTETARFHLCTRCGVVPFVTSHIEDRLYAVVSVNALEGIDAALLDRAPSNVEGEDKDVRLARRRRNWIGDVAFVERGSASLHAQAHLLGQLA